jgi:hypothetical protein
VDIPGNPKCINHSPAGTQLLERGRSLTWPGEEEQRGGSSLIFPGRVQDVLGWEIPSQETTSHRTSFQILPPPPNLDYITSLWSLNFLLCSLGLTMLCLWAVNRVTDRQLEGAA